MESIKTVHDRPAWLTVKGVIYYSLFFNRVFVPETYILESPLFLTFVHCTCDLVVKYTDFLGFTFCEMSLS